MEASAGLLQRVRMTGDPVAGPGGAGPRRPRALHRPDRPPAAARVVADAGVRGPRHVRVPAPPRASRRRSPSATRTATTVIDTGALVLRHTPDGRPFHAGNLSVERAGAVRATGRRERSTAPTSAARAGRSTAVRGGAALEPGLVSRSGWALVDDSARRRLRAPTAGSSRAPNARRTRTGTSSATGTTTPARSAEYTRFGGAIPLDPALGARRLVVALLALQRRRRARAGRRLPRARPAARRLRARHGLAHDRTAGPATAGTASCSPIRAASSPGCTSEGLHTTLNLHPALGVQAVRGRLPGVRGGDGRRPGERRGGAVPDRRPRVRAPLLRAAAPPARGRRRRLLVDRLAAGRRPPSCPGSTRCRGSTTCTSPTSAPARAAGR